MVPHRAPQVPPPVSIDRQKVAEAAQKLAAKGQLDKAIVEYQRVLREDPNDVRVLLKVGDLQVRMQTPAAAADTYQRVAALYEQQGLHQKAIAVYKQILQIDPSRDALHLKLADLYVRLGLGPDAMQHLTAAAQRFAKAAQLEPLEAVYRKMLQVDASNVATRIRLAELLSKLGRNADAVAEFEESCKLLESMGRQEEWGRVAERLSFFKPDDATLARKLAALYLDQDDARRALPKIQVAYKADARHVPTLEMLVRAFRGLGQLPKALPVLKEIARIHGDAGRVRDRIETWKRVLDLAPTDEEARAALRETSERRDEAAKALAAEEELAEVEEIVAEDGDDIMVVEEEEVVFDLKPSVPPAREEIPLPPGPAPAVAAAPAPASSTARASSRPPGPRAANPLLARPPVRAAAAVAAPAPSTQERNATEAARLVGEAEIFLKYGLRSKVSDHLAKAVQLDASSVELQARVRDLYIAMNDPGGIVRSSVRVAQLVASHDPAGALAEVARALEIDPHDAAARALYDELQPSPRAAGYAPESTLNEGNAVYALDVDPYAQGLADDFAEATEGTAMQSPSGSWDEAVDGPRPEIEEGLDEAEFFVTQGLYDDARDTLRQLLEMYPNHPLVLDRWAELEQLALMRGADQGAMGGDFGLGAVFDEESQALGMLEGTAEGIALDEGFDGLTQEASGSVSVEDCDTHYDLGIAYKEMGLYDDAIAEFKIATYSPVRQCIGDTMIGLCYMEKGDYASAVEHFKRGLQAPQRTEHEELGLYFEMGIAYQTLGDYAEALYYFQKVEKRDPYFREVNQFVVALQAYVGHSTSQARITPGIEDLDRAFDELVNENE